MIKLHLDTTWGAILMIVRMAMCQLEGTVECRRHHVATIGRRAGLRGTPGNRRPEETAVAAGAEVSLDCYAPGRLARRDVIGRNPSRPPRPTRSTSPCSRAVSSRCDHRRHRAFPNRYAERGPGIAHGKLYRMAGRFLPGRFPALGNDDD